MKHKLMNDINNDGESPPPLPETIPNKVKRSESSDSNNSILSGRAIELAKTSSLHGENFQNMAILCIQKKDIRCICKYTVLPTMGTHISFMLRGYDPYILGLKPSFFMVLGSKGSVLLLHSSISSIVSFNSFISCFANPTFSISSRTFFSKQHSHHLNKPPTII